MRIGLNLLHALPGIGGGWNYIANLVGALGKCDHTNTYVCFVTRESERLVPDNSNFKPVRVNIRAANRVQRIVYENTILQILARQHKLDCMHWFANAQALLNTVPGVVTIHDLLVFQNSRNFPVIRRIYLRLMLPLTVKGAAMLLPVSQATAQELRSMLHADPTRMVVIPVMLKPEFEPVSADRIARFRVKYRLPDRFWLYVAHLYPHKNHICLLRAYHGLKSSGFTPWPLVLRGDAKDAEADVMHTIVRLNLEKDVVFLPRLNEEELPVLYSAATALVFPSLYEGGGIPIVESMACGCPIVASDIPPAREFAGEAGLYFDPRDPDSIGWAMVELQRNPDLRERQRQAGLARAADFRPQPVVSKLLSAYRQAARK